LTASEVLSGDSRVMQTIARYLETLRGTIDGDELHGLIARTLRRHSREGPAGPDCLLDLYRQLDAYARDALTLPNMRIRARLLQQHLLPYINDSMPAAPLPEHPPAAGPTAARAPAAAPARHAGRPAVTVTYNGNEVTMEGVLERPGESEQRAADERNEKYQTLLRSEKDAWQAIYGTVKDYQRLKDAWLKSLDELARQRDALEEKLLKTTEHLGKLEGEHERLRAELAQAQAAVAQPRYVHSEPRLLSRLGNRPGELPARDRFEWQLQAEIKRIKRSRAPLALGLIRIDLDVLTERHGDEAASVALACYAEEILSNFRAYDIVSLYGGDRFAVMFPDTSMEGARRALEKAYKRAIETHLNYSGACIPLPPFAGALIAYSPGEDPATFLRRANQVLDDARSGGRHGIVSPDRRNP